MVRVLSFMSLGAGCGGLGSELGMSLSGSLALLLILYPFLAALLWRSGS